MSMLKPIASASLAEIAFSNLVEAISAGEFEPGQRLSEADLARRFGISRGPLREALQRLEGRLVTRRARVGVHVIELSADAIRELFVIREALEGLAARLAAENAGKSDIKALRNLLSRHRQGPGTEGGRRLSAEHVRHRFPCHHRAARLQPTAGKSAARQSLLSTQALSIPFEREIRQGAGGVRRTCCGCRRD